ncbi:MAG TPA: RDD family protein [Ilumatobacteraceae bacterium]|jgi:uncharacterized RDD family membrane protein YckC
MEEPKMESVRIDRLSDEQRMRLEAYLRGAKIPFEITDTGVSVEAHHAEDLYSVLKLVGNAASDGDDDDDDDDGAAFDPHSADWSVSPLSPGRAKARDGRAYASSNRRAIAGMIDWFVLLVVPVVALTSGAANWAVVAALAAYTIIAVAVLGRTLGKLVVGIKVIEANGRRAPGFAASALRWFVVSWSVVLGLFANSLPIGVVVAVFVVLACTYAPILWDDRGQGWHDRLADTVVVDTRSTR